MTISKEDAQRNKKVHDVMDEVAEHIKGYFPTDRHAQLDLALKAFLVLADTYDVSEKSITEQVVKLYRPLERLKKLDRTIGQN